jgi:hypothetical protein
LYGHKEGKFLRNSYLLLSKGFDKLSQIDAYDRNLETFNAEDAFFILISLENFFGLDLHDASITNRV